MVFISFLFSLSLSLYFNSSKYTIIQICTTSGRLSWPNVRCGNRILERYKCAREKFICVMCILDRRDIPLARRRRVVSTGDKSYLTDRFHWSLFNEITCMWVNTYNYTLVKCYIREVLHWSQADSRISKFKLQGMFIRDKNYT